MTLVSCHPFHSTNISQPPALHWILEAPDRGDSGLHGEAQHPAGLSPPPHWPGTWGVPGGQGSGSGSGQLPRDGDVCWISLCQAGKSRGLSSLGMVDTVVEGQRVWVGHRGSEGFQTGNHSTCHPSAHALFASSCYLWPHLTGGGEGTDLTSVHVSTKELTFQHLQRHSGELVAMPPREGQLGSKEQGGCSLLCTKAPSWLHHPISACNPFPPLPPPNPSLELTPSRKPSYAIPGLLSLHSPSLCLGGLP